MVKTTPKFWDCECDTKYIHPKRIKECKVCKADKDEQPDSIASEVKKHPELIAEPEKMDKATALFIESLIKEYSKEASKYFESCHLCPDNEDMANYIVDAHCDDAGMFFSEELYNQMLDYMEED